MHDARTEHANDEQRGGSKPRETWNAIAHQRGIHAPPRVDKLQDGKPAKEKR